MSCLLQGQLRGEKSFNLDELLLLLYLCLLHCQAFASYCFALPSWSFEHFSSHLIAPNEECTTCISGLYLLSPSSSGYSLGQADEAAVQPSLHRSQIGPISKNSSWSHAWSSDPWYFGVTDSSSIRHTAKMLSLHIFMPSQFSQPLDLYELSLTEKGTHQTIAKLWQWCRTASSLFSLLARNPHLLQVFPIRRPWFGRKYASP